MVTVASGPENASWLEGETAMAYETVRQVLEAVRDFHRKLERVYERQSDAAERDKMRRILDFMAGHEAALEQWVAETESELTPELLDTRFHFMPDIAECGEVEKTSLPDDVSVDDAIRTALRFDDCLVAYYRQLAEGPVPKEVQQLFRYLRDGERSEERETIESALLISEP
jgi:rubrerythrin